MIRNTVILATLFLLGACASRGPVVIDETQPEALRSLHARLVEVVAAAEADPHHEWVYGIEGNERINGGEEGLRGLCYEWQEIVFRESEPLARIWSWRAAMIEINAGTLLEHHAVLVHPRASGSPEEVLERRDPGAFVLDPWREGGPDVYRLPDWLRLPIIVLESAAIE